MNTGQMRHRVTVQAPTQSIDSFRQKLAGWADVGTFWAFVEPLSGSQAIVAEQLQAKLTHRVHMRRNPDLPLTTKHQLVFQGRALRIAAVVDLGEQRRELRVDCEEIPGQALP